MERLNSIFRNNLVYYMELRGKTQIELAKATGAAASTVSYWMRGEKVPRADKLEAICRFLRIDMNDLLLERVPVQSFEQELFYNEAVMMREFGELSDRDKQVVRDLIDSLTKKGDE